MLVYNLAARIAEPTAPLPEQPENDRENLQSLEGAVVESFGLFSARRERD